jgi:hypothetical protein
MKAQDRTAYPGERSRLPRPERGLFLVIMHPAFAALTGLRGIHVKMTAKAWCAISKAVEMIKTAQNTSVGRAEAWLIEACVAGNIRSRVPSSADSELLLNDNGPVSMDPRPGSRPGIISRRRAPESVSPAAWNDAVIDGDVLVDTNQGRWSDLEISIADLEFDLKQTLRQPRPLGRLPGREAASLIRKRLLRRRSGGSQQMNRYRPPYQPLLANCISGSTSSRRSFEETMLGRFLAPRRSRSTFGLFRVSIKYRGE